MGINRGPILLAVVSAVVGLTLTTVAVVRSRTDAAEPARLTAMLLGSFEADSVRGEEPPRLEQSEAQAAAREIVRDWMPQTDVSQRAIKASGTGVAPADLQLQELIFVPAAARVSSSKYSFEYTTPRPADVWIAVFQVNGLRIDDWDISDGGLFVSVVFEEDSLEAKSVRIELFNPNLPGPHQGKTGK